MIYFVPYLLKPKGYVRIGQAVYAKPEDANLRGFIEHVENGKGCQPYFVLPVEGDDLFDTAPLIFPKTYKRPEAEVLANVEKYGEATLTIVEMREFLRHAAKFDTPGGFDFRMQSYGADNCEEQHRTGYGCDCWTGASEEDVEMLSEIRDTSEYPAFAIWSHKVPAKCPECERPFSEKALGSDDIDILVAATEEYELNLFAQQSDDMGKAHGALDRLAERTGLTPLVKHARRRLGEKQEG